jgi:hypothetical protein
MNCGKYIVGYFESDHNDSASTAQLLMKGAPNTFNAITNKEKTEQTLFKTGDVSALTLCAG